MRVDLALILVVLAVVTGVIWALDAWVFAPRRRDTISPQNRINEVSEPIVVEYARTFFPVIVVVLFVRSFLYEPFRIPSSSMEPTLLVGDFIFVNKFNYGLRLPVLNSKVWENGEPKRGDVVVFRLPSDEGVNYIKRVIGLPGDRIVYDNKQLTINGEAIPVIMGSRSRAPDGFAIQSGIEVIGEVDHQVQFRLNQRAQRHETVVPEGHYFVMGDNRDNSQDSRFVEDVGFIPEENLVGRAVRIWLNWDFMNGAPQWSRIGDKII